ncbi:hypothetical protein BH10PAT2_BH10PAT2_0600 [soil metagenome]
MDQQNTQPFVQPAAQVPPQTPPQVAPTPSWQPPQAMFGGDPQKRKIGKIIIGLVFVIILAGALYSHFMPPQARYVTVSGEAKQVVPAGGAQIVIQLETNNSDRNSLINNGESQYKNLSDKLAAVGGVTVEQSGAQILPPNSTTNANSYYIYRRTAKITVVGQDNVNVALGILNADTVTIAQTVYTPQGDTAQFKADLLRQAVENAKVKAGTLSSATGTHVGQVLNVTETTASQDSGNVLSNTSTNSSSSVELSADVNVTYQLW